MNDLTPLQCFVIGLGFGFAALSPLIYLFWKALAKARTARPSLPTERDGLACTPPGVEVDLRQEIAALRETIRERDDEIAGLRRRFDRDGAS